MSATAKAATYSAILRDHPVTLSPLPAAITLDELIAIKGDERGITYRRLAAHQKRALAVECAVRTGKSSEEAQTYLDRRFGGK